MLYCQTLYCRNELTVKQGIAFLEAKELPWNFPVFWEGRYWDEVISTLINQFQVIASIRVTTVGLPLNTRGCLSSPKFLECDLRTFISERRVSALMVGEGSWIWRVPEPKVHTWQPDQMRLLLGSNTSIFYNSCNIFNMGSGVNAVQRLGFHSFDSVRSVIFVWGCHFSRLVGRISNPATQRVLSEI